ncbi:MAG: hypothetical protein KF903_10275 [Dokdonella sp.]|uniref:DUF6683 family protein n=1 Tax=Dokdonella sp. TaxID=2291710 RepID=UPI0025C18A07|nr:DUF6683 family protein [Dokdonella sp.]MBX3701369.1 hypothetical protein [Dokdonella sp.]
MKLRSLLIAFTLLLAGETAFAQSAALKFAPVAGDDTLRNFADQLGDNPQQRRELLEAITTAKKELFEQPYGPRGWKNNVAGAYAGFVVGLATVLSGEAPSTAVEDRVFADFSAKLAPAMANVSNKEKAALYDTLIASASLPVLLYIDGNQKGNAAQIKQARTLAAEYSRKILHSEPQELLAMLSPAKTATATTTPAPAQQSAGAAGGGGPLDGRYDCLMAAMQFDGVSFVTQYRPTGMWFTISGNRYSAQSGGGTISATADVVSFSGGAYNGWRGARRGDAIVFRKNDYTNPHPGESIKRDDFRCGRRSG